MTDLGTPFQLACGVTIKNRLMKAAMSEQFADPQNDPTPGHAALYGRWAQGGIGLCITGHVMVDRQALSEPGNVVLDDDSNLYAFGRWTKAGTQHGTQLWAQLNHPGKQSPDFLSKQPVAPSALKLEDGLAVRFKPPRELTDAEILTLIDKYARCAELAKQVGFSGVQIHGAHGYLVSQFLSPKHNRRSDRWGGSLQNRMRFVIDIYRAIRQRVGADFPIGLKLNSSDFMKGGFDEEDSLQVVRAMADEGVDLIEISGGSYEKVVFIEGRTVKDSTRHREAYFLDFAEQLRRVTDCPLAVTGGFRSAAAMKEALGSGATDFIGLARPMVVDPDLPHKLINEDDHVIAVPPRSTGIKKLDHMTVIDVLWYQQQMKRMSNKKEPDAGMSEWIAIWHSFGSIGRHAFRRVRA